MASRPRSKRGSEQRKALPKTKSAAAGTLRGAADARPADTEGHIRVRMYRVGFGDCFLISLPTNAGGAHILIDCGVHSAGDLGMIPEIVDNIAAETERHLTLVVATHAHADHISGFAKCEDKFKTFRVDEVWLPWTENPTDGQAQKLKQKHLELAAHLHMHFQAINADGSRAEEAMAAAINAAPNPAALALLKSGINGGAVEYLAAGKVLKDAAGIEGLTVQILGPPREEAFLARMNPPAGDRFFRLGSRGKRVPVNAILPFENKWIAKPKSSLGLPRLSKQDLKLLEETVDDAAGLAFALDQAINNTSVVALLSYRGKNLLFPGDAQYGNWDSWMKTPDGEAILQRVDFFKVAHHGSHNATPKSALEHMRDGFSAMISTQSHPWKSIPFDKMLSLLGKKAAGVVRSDSIAISAGKKIPPTGPALRLPKGFSVGSFWCDYILPL